MSCVRECQVSGCERVPYAADDCRAHYTQRQRNGRVTATQVRARTSNEDRGTGAILCQSCGQALRDHDLEWRCRR